MPISRHGGAIAKLSIAEAPGLLPALTLSLVLAAQSMAKAWIDKLKNPASYLILRVISRCNKTEETNA